MCRELSFLALLAVAACDPRSAPRSTVSAPPVATADASPVAPSPPARDAAPQPHVGTCVRIGRLLDWRYSPSVSVLLDGRVLVVGGRHHDGDDFLKSVEIWAPASGAFAPAAPLHDERAMHAAVVLADGRVLVAGGLAKAIEIYDPAKNRWTVVGALPQPVVTPFVSVLPDGRVLIAGGDLQWKGAMSSATFFFDPKTNHLTPGPDLARDEGGGEPGLAVAFDANVLLVLHDTVDHGPTSWLFDPKTGAYAKAAPDDRRVLAFQALEGGMKDDELLLDAGDGRGHIPAIAMFKDALRRSFNATEWEDLARFNDEHDAGGGALVDAHTAIVVGGLREAQRTAERCVF
jgi:hypothetical protein